MTNQMLDDLYQEHGKAAVERALRYLETAPQADMLRLILKFREMEADWEHLKLCEKEIVAIRGLVLKPDDAIRGEWLAFSVGSPTGITGAVEARMGQLKNTSDLADYLKKQLEQIWRLARIVTPTDLGDAIRILTNIAEIAGHEPEKDEV